jgi:hypothetical protein
MKRVLIIGGYGNFGSFIARQLACDHHIQLIIAGRSKDKAEEFASHLTSINPVETACLDINGNLEKTLGKLQPDIVIHTSGPFQSQGYDVAQACIAQGCHYIDLADGREFVENITILNKVAVEKNVLVISGASSVPCLTSALIDHYKDQFQNLHTVDYGITTAQKTNRGVATTAAILSYTGKAFTTLIDGRMTNIYGWQGLHLRKYHGLGHRLLGYCNIPDLSLFPKRYPDIETIRFYAGLEVPFIHMGLWGLSWLVRIGLIRHLERAAPALLRMARLFDAFGTSDSALHMELSGTGFDGDEKTICFELIARNGDGPYIPCIPAILLAQRLAKEEPLHTGAFPCVDFVTLNDYLAALQGLDITYQTR